MKSRTNSPLPTDISLQPVQRSSSGDGGPTSGEVVRSEHGRELEGDGEIAELRRAGEEHERRLMLSVKLGMAAWWEWDVDSERLVCLGGSSEIPELDWNVDTSEPGTGQWARLVHPNDLVRARQAFQRCLQEPEETGACEVRARALSGGWRWVLLAASAIHRDGRPTRIFGTVRDIDTEKAARVLAHRNAELLASLDDAILCTDLEGGIEYWNDAARRLLEFHGQEQLGGSIFEFFSAGDESQLRFFYRYGLEGEGRKFDLLRVRADGASAWLDVKLTAFRDGAGRVAGVVCSLRDTSDRRSTEQTMRRDAHVLAQLEDAVVCMDTQLRVIYWNDAAERIFEWDRSEIIGQSILVRLPPEVHEVVTTTMHELLVTGRARATEWEDYRKDGSRRTIYWRSQPLADHTGRTVGVVSVGTDVTAQRTAERQKVELELRLIHAQKIETLGQLSSRIAHDFNNVLTTILMHTEVALAEPAVSTKLRSALENIRSGGDRASALVRRIVDFSRRDEPMRRLVVLGRVLHDVADFIRVSLPSTIAMQVDAPADCPATFADENQLHQVLVNLASNAIAAMPEGGVLSLRLRETTLGQALTTPIGAVGPGHYLTIEVSDSGLGLNAENAVHLFEPFFTTKPPGAGTGLGLAIVASVVAEHGGGVAVVSRAHGGSTFTVYLPVAGK